MTDFIPKLEARYQDQEVLFMLGSDYAFHGNILQRQLNNCKKMVMTVL